MQLRLSRIDRKDPKMKEISEPGIARTALLAELKELEEAFRSGDMGDVCDEAGDVLHCAIYLHAATVEHEEKGAANRAANRTAARWDTVMLGVQQQERNHRLEAWREKVRSQVDEDGCNKLMKGLRTRMMAPTAKKVLNGGDLEGHAEEIP